MKQSNYAGFTLIESLIVLSLVASLILLPTLAISKWRERLEVDFFLTRFEKKIIQCQQSAAVTQKVTRVVGRHYDDFIEFEYSNSFGITENSRLSYPKGMAINGDVVLSFKSITGNISKSMSFSFTDTGGKRSIKYTLHVGGGRFYREETPL